jgi:ABC-2 type transport system ATP-binding protein
VSGAGLALEVAGLRKSFGDTVALDGVDLRVPAGSVAALLGPNGAGKTTAVQILSTLLRADHGEVRVAGHDAIREPDAVRRAIGVTGQFSAVDLLLTGEENLLLMADLHHLTRDEGRRLGAALLERFDLVDVARRPATTYSGGMRRRLDLAMTLVGSPRIIFLDEPTTGLDPRSRRTVWRIVRELVDEGVTVLLTTHYLEEADRLADRVAVLDRGRVIAEGTPDQLKSRLPGGSIRVQLPDEGSLRGAEAALPGSIRDEDGLALTVASDGTPSALRDVLDRLERASIEAERVTVRTPDLDEVFLALTDDPADHPVDGHPGDRSLDRAGDRRGGDRR